MLVRLLSLDRWVFLGCVVGSLRAGLAWGSSGILGGIRGSRVIPTAVSSRGFLMAVSSRDRLMEVSNKAILHRVDAILASSRGSRTVGGSRGMLHKVVSVEQVLDGHEIGLMRLWTGTHGSSGGQT
jgi:hypothetical protein